MAVNPENRLYSKEIGDGVDMPDLIVASYALTYCVLLPGVAAFFLRTESLAGAIAVGGFACASFVFVIGAMLRRRSPTGWWRAAGISAALNYAVGLSVLFIFYGRDAIIPVVTGLLLGVAIPVLPWSFGGGE
ncbi:MAG: hypothetical protein AAFR11_06795 [Pseudomonadota bacterium]